MEFQRLLYSVDDRVARITLNRPAKRNALDDLMIRELTTAFGLVARDNAAKVVVLRGAGPAFCAGMDLEYLERVSRFDLEQNRNDSFRLANLLRTVYELKKPVVAVVEGAAVAGGCGLASACDFVLASREDARFGYSEVRIGFVPAIVMPFLVKRVGEGRARALLLRGDTITADEAMAIGLVTAAVPRAALETAVTELMGKLLESNSGTSMGLTKEMMSRLEGMNLVDALDFGANMNAAARMTADCKQGVKAFLNKEKPRW
jgi:methylglutaconyl-CoA hydratase